MGSSAPLRIAVVGAGIGGLATAIALRAKGHEVDVYDQASELTAIGAGIALGANGMKVLDRLGLGPAVRDAASNLQRIQFHHWKTGDIFYEHPMGDWYDERFGGPFLGIHRADMHQVLLDAYDGSPLLGHRATAVRESEDAAEVEFANGTTVTADVVIGADGLRSAVREHVTGPDEAVFSAMSCYRGLVPVEKVPGGDEMGLTFFLGPNRHLVVYPVRGGELINFVAYVPDPEWTLESWSSKADSAEAVAAFAGWNDTVTTMLANVQETGRWALYDREPLRRWSTGRVTLLGDAAHPMLPHAGQGSNQAIEDVSVLVALLGDGDLPVADALHRYEQIRKPRTRQIQMGSRGNAACFQLPDGPAADERNARLLSLPDNVAWIHGHDPESDLTPVA
ncbi:FAD-dependent monooxygenase [Dactylosporangium sp. AC04546]|uniref:FAD-dependent monooxygenase n=1 Tax=Dactylosporangium sp. AC04546 TaxID=2862460 RepID=UPI001EE13940|nr:FAD-dependent monooxygenase [Dactylosporangium sp. AC04546]WVK80044.1 FAD-dependent monooxygenase [Dactylosporangium sp. AC04546]